MSEYVSDMSQACYRCTAYIKRATDACLGHVIEVYKKCLTQGLGNRNVHVVYMTCLKLALNASVTYSMCL